MRPVCRLYFALCKRIGPRKLTISAWLWARELEGRGYFLRELVDDAFLCFRGDVDHCKSQFLRETAHRAPASSQVARLLKESPLDSRKSQ